MRLRLIAAGLLWAGGAAAQVPEGRLAGVLGANKVDLATQYLGTASNGDGSPAMLAVTRAMGRKAIADAGDIGFAFLRVMAAGYAPVAPSQAGKPRADDLLLWRRDPAAFWARMDAMFDDLDRYGVRIVPSFVWNPFQFPAITGETLARMIRDPESQSRRMLRRFIAEFIGRYRARRTILFYELGNELNLEADIDIRKLCLQSHPAASDCAAYEDFTSAELLAFARAVVADVKALDPSRPVGSGYSLPRPASFHLARRPGFARGGPDWTADSAEQFAAHFAAISAPFDLWSIHLYPGDVRFRNEARSEARTLDAAASVARRAGRRLYVGEFADGTVVSPFLTMMLRRFADDGVAYAAVWVWEFYQASPWQSANLTAKPAQSLEPGFTDAIDALLARAIGRPTWHDDGTPRVVLTAPLPCQMVSRGGVDLHAVASAAAPVSGVTFRVNGTPVGTAADVPYHVRIRPPGNGLATIEATALAGGRTATASAPVRLGPPATACAQLGK